VRTAGDPRIAAKLADALDVKAAPEPARVRADPMGGVDPGRTGASGEGLDRGEDDPDRSHIHGFHTYPARMHPVTAGRLVRATTEAGAVVLDPFCGSGTVLVEAMIAGRRAVGTDLNPLAERLARLKTSRPDETEREGLVAGAHEVAAFATERRERRAGATRRYPREDAALFDPHVLLELDSIRAGIAGLDLPDGARQGLGLVLSSILTKVSRRASDTATSASARRIAAGYPSRLFVRKTQELARRLAAFDALVPPGTPAARVTLDDATRLSTVGASTVDAVVTSPPYAAWWSR
jgi:hypothetical protein